MSFMERQLLVAPMAQVQFLDVPVNTRSTVITSPSNGTLFPFPGNITITANATETDGTGISRVDFYQGNNFIGRAFTAPYSISWNPAQPGTYALYRRCNR